MFTHERSNMCITVPCSVRRRPRVQKRREKLVFFFKQKTAYEILSGLVGSEMCIRDRIKTSLTSEPIDFEDNLDMTGVRREIGHDC